MKNHLPEKRLAAGLSIAALVLCCLLALLHPRAVPTLSAQEGAISLPVVMYHQVLSSDSKLLGEYVVSKEELEADLAWIKAAGYTPITGQQLLDYVDGKGVLPQHPILLTFDDGHESFFVNVLPLLEKYDAKALVSVIGRYSDLYSQPDAVKHLNYSHLSWEQVRQLGENPRVDVGNHSYDRHDATGKESPAGAKLAKGADEQQYRQRLEADTMRTQQAIEQATGQRPTIYVYPFGYYSKQSESLLKEMGYRMTLSCESRNNAITKDPDCLYLLGRYNRVHGLRSADFFAKMGLEPLPLETGLVERG